MHSFDTLRNDGGVSDCKCLLKINDQYHDVDTIKNKHRTDTGKKCELARFKTVIIEELQILIVTVQIEKKRIKLPIEHSKPIN